MKTTPDTTPPEPADPLAALEAKAAALEQDQAHQDAQPSPQEVHAAKTAKADLLDTLKMLRGVAGPACHWMTEDRFAKTWNDARLGDIAEAGAAIMERHGWTIGALFGTYGPYIALIAAMGAPTLETIRAYKEATSVQAVQPTGADNGSTEGS